MRLTERKVIYPNCDKQGNLTKVDYIEIKDKKLAEEKLCKFEDIEEKYNISSLDDLEKMLIPYFKEFINTCIKLDVAITKDSIYRSLLNDDKAMEP